MMNPTTISEDLLEASTFPVSQTDPAGPAGQGVSRSSSRRASHLAPRGVGREEEGNPNRGLHGKKNYEVVIHLGGQSLRPKRSCTLGFCTRATPSVSAS
mmetsp:Transcript_48450/g.103785  ORF Transcript_48450/g.103785 Transcript_48450/m.103785 type:complete len:99 (+) Transcript_48450:1268-1564(+)